MATAPAAAGPRIYWWSVPEHVRAAVEDQLGTPVTSAVTQLGGFSPGAAARLVLADGRRVFVKAVGSALNPDTPLLHRREIVALRVLPDDVPHARLLWSYDDGDWVVLVLEDVDGRRPASPWSAPDVEAVARALVAVGANDAHPEIPVVAEIVNALTAWDEVAADPTDIDPQLLARLPEMLNHQARAREVTTGESLLHWDIRGDNVLLRDGQAVLVDWAWACRGAPWLDPLLLAADLLISGGPDPDEFLRAQASTRNVPPGDLAAVVACMAGIWTERARRPSPPGLPTIRAWQAHCAEQALGWLDTGRMWS